MNRQPPFGKLPVQLWQDVCERCKDSCLPIPQKDVFFSEIRVLSQKEIFAWCEIVQACASHIWTNQYLTALNDEDFQAIDRYIQKHLTESVRASDICMATGIPKNRVYETVRRNTGFSVNTYIWSLRIDKATTGFTCGKNIGYAMIDLDKVAIGDKATINGYEVVLTEKKFI